MEYHRCCSFVHSLFGFSEQVLFQVFSNPGTRKDQWPRWNLRAYFPTSTEFWWHSSVLSFSLHIMSSNMDMKMILLVKCPVSHCIFFMNFWISSRMPIVVNLGKIFHSNSVCMPLMRFNSLKWLVFEYHLILFFQATFGSPPISPIQSTESEKTSTSAVVTW